jgi:hypothetical protein
MSGVYDGGFYDWQSSASYQSARVVLPLLRRWLPFASMVDVGCGAGAWLRAAGELGVPELHGFDGPWVDRARLPQGVRFISADLERGAGLQSRVDLAMSVEVAEHVSAQRAPGFINDLCDAADVVLFGAAIPGQGGEHHVNEQWPSYWARLFAERGYACFDCIRPAIWANDSVEIWYRQNVLVYVAPKAAVHFTGLTPVLPSEFGRLDVVHPQLWLRRQPAQIVARLGARQRVRAVLGLPRALVEKIEDKVRRARHGAAASRRSNGIGGDH